MNSYKILILIAFYISFPLNNIYPCTMIAAANDTVVLAGNNEDYSDPNTYVWFTRKSDYRKYGCIFFGYSNMRPQGGMNEAGLCFDAFATAPNPISALYQDDLLLFPLNDDNITDMVMRTCGTVSEVIFLMKQYNLIFMKNFQLMFVDKFGDSAIIEGEKVIWKNDYYQVCTNFYHSNPSLGGYPCWRFDAAVEKFEGLIDSVSIPLFREILNTTHQEGEFPTLYSNIYDLNNGTVYLYYNHYFDEVIKFDLQEGLNMGNCKYSIPSLYSNLIIKSPVDGMILNATSATFNWEGEGENYQLYYSIDPGLNNYEVIEISKSDFNEKASIPFIISIIIPFFLIKGKMKISRFMRIGFMVTISFIFISCSANNITSPSNDYDIKISNNLITVTIHNLHPDANYYWKIKAERNGPFKSESPIYNFTLSGK